MPTWVDDCCAMRSPVMESGRSGGTTNLITLSKVPGNPVWTDDPCIHQNQFQTQQTHDVANEAIAEQVE